LVKTAIWLNFLSWFYNKNVELPDAQPTPEPDSLTDYLCLVCSAFLEKYAYTKEGKAKVMLKVMLRCAIAANRKGKCKDVAFF
jgi:DNA topoisomerase I